MPGSTPSRPPRGPNHPVTPMSERQQLKLVRQLETEDNHGGNTPPNLRARSRSCNGRGETPLHKAAIKGDEELVLKLLEEGADPNTPDFAGWTPLHEACNHGKYGVALVLLQAGASVNARGFDDDTPLHDAAINGHSKLVRLLVERGADVHSRNKGGKTPRDVAAPGLIAHLKAVAENIELSGRRSGSAKPDARSGSGHSDDTALCEMRRAPTHSKVDKSPKVTLRLHHIKKKTGKVNPEGSTSTMDEKSNKEDVYEFKSSKEATPVRGNSRSPDVEKTNSEGKTDCKTGEICTNADNEAASGKRNIADVTETDDNEDDTKKKKRKEGESSKEAGTPSKTVSTASRLAAVRNTSSAEKASKLGSHLGKSVAAAATKTALLGACGSVNNDRKSPSSPKGTSATVGVSNIATKTEAGEADDKVSGDGEKTGLGPKVPPLKIVIPQQSGSEPEQGNRNGKSSTSRHHQALPYVVSSNSNDSEKDGQRSGSVSPTDSLKSDEKKDPAIGMLSAEDQKGSNHQRVLRSHRGNADERTSSKESNAPVKQYSSSSSNGNGTTAVPTPSQASSTSIATPAEGGSPSSQAPAQQGTVADSVDGSTSSTSTTTAPPTEPVTTASTSTSHGSSKSSTAKPSGGNTNSSGTTSTEEKPKQEEHAESMPTTAPTPPAPAPVELHPRKRKLKHNKEVKEAKEAPAAAQTSELPEPSNTAEVNPLDQPVKNCYQLFLDIRKQIDRRRKGLFPVQPKPPQGFNNYLMNRCTYVLAGNASTRQIPSSAMPQNLPHQAIKDLFTEQEKERQKLRLQHVIEKEKLVLSVEQEILRVHGRAARALANQSLPFSVCTILKDEEVYNLITPEQEEKDRNARSRYNGRLFLSWLQDVDDKWEKIKENMLLRHHNEAESLHAVQKMDWEWKMKELGLCEFKSKPVILDTHVPMVNITDDFDLLPA